MKEENRLFERVQKPIYLFERVNALSEFKNNQSTDIVEHKWYDGVLVLDQVPEFNIVDYDLYNKKEFDHYIDDVKRVVRSSFEYRRFVNYLRDYMDMNKCSFFQNVTNKDTFKIKIELHHHPFTLHDIVLTIYNKRIANNESVEVEMVAKEVMYIHYFCMVGIIPLAKTVHQLVHKQFLFIPIDTVFGNYEEFIEIYGDYIPPEAREKYDAINAQTLVYDEISNLQVLQQSPLIVQLPGDDGSGTYNLPKLEAISSLMKKRAIELKENKPSIENKAA